MKHGKNHVSEMFPAKQRYICQKFQQGFKSLPSAHPDEAFVQPALHPAQWLHHAPAREGHQAAKALEVQHVWLHLQD